MLPDTGPRTGAPSRRSQTGIARRLGRVPFEQSGRLKGCPALKRWVSLSEVQSLGSGTRARRDARCRHPRGILGSCRSEDRVPRGVSPPFSARGRRQGPTARPSWPPGHTLPIRVVGLFLDFAEGVGPTPLAGASERPIPGASGSLRSLPSALRRTKSNAHARSSLPDYRGIQPPSCPPPPWLSCS